jgi:hypothetical protein
VDAMDISDLLTLILMLLGVYRPKFGAMVLASHAAELAAIEVT